MNTNRKTLKTRFSAETRFELQPAQDLSFHAVSGDAFERLKDRLYAIRLNETGTKWEAPLRDAASEAAALAWTTMVPSLVFPVLFEEKVAAAISQEKRQARILKKSRALLAA